MLLVEKRKDVLSQREKNKKGLGKERERRGTY